MEGRAQSEKRPRSGPRGPLTEAVAFFIVVMLTSKLP